MNICNRCKNEFIYSLNPSGLPYKCCDNCREQQKEYYKEYYKENADKKKEYRKTNADKIKEQKKEYYKENTDKIKEYYKENANKIKEQKKEYYKANADKIKEYKKEYNKENADKRKEYYENIKTTNLPLYLVKIQRTQIKRCFSKSSLDKSKHSIEYLGCNIETFINHIQKKIDIFNEKNEIKMTFDNIHLDHIKPVSRFNLDDENEFLDCCHYTNFQPLLAKDNLEKHNKWSDDNNKFWIENIKGKEYYEIYI